MGQLTYKISPSVRQVLKRLDWLGFDSEKECADALLTHTDWSERWDLSEADAMDIEIIYDWRMAVLLNNQVNGPINNLFEQIAATLKK